MKIGTHCYDDRIEICIPMQPITKKNSSRILTKYIRDESGKSKKIPFVSPSKQFSNYQKQAGVFLRSLNINYPMNIEAHFYMKTKGVVDLSNLNESIHDIMVKCGVIYDDEAYFIVSTDGSRVHYDKDNPRTEIIITKTTPTFPMRAKLKEVFEVSDTKSKRIRRKNPQKLH